MNEKILDLSALSQADYERVLAGWEDFNKNTKVARYFGYVDKKNLKHVCKFMNYVDARSWIGGLLFVPAVVGGAYVGYKVSTWIEESRNKDVEV